jgi:hypothetical protein
LPKDRGLKGSWKFETGNWKLGRLGIGDWGLGIGDWGLGKEKDVSYPAPQFQISNFQFLTLVVVKLLVGYVLVEELVDLVNVKIAFDLAQLVHLDVDVVQLGSFFSGGGIRGGSGFRFVSFGHIYDAIYCMRFADVNICRAGWRKLAFPV